MKKLQDMNLSDRPSWGRSYRRMCQNHLDSFEAGYHL